MPEQKRELYSSPNGDKWFLSRDPLPTRSSAVESLRHEPQKTKVRERRGVQIAQVGIAGPAPSTRCT
jgi:hypothetical protein